MTRHVDSTRGFPVTYSNVHAPITITGGFPGRPCAGGALVLAPLPVGADGDPFLGMDPSSPVTWVRPYNPQPGMVARLNFDGAKYQGQVAMGGTWRNPMRDRADAGVRPNRRRRGRPRTGRRRLDGSPQAPAESQDLRPGRESFDGHVRCPPGRGA